MVNILLGSNDDGFNSNRFFATLDQNVNDVIEDHEYDPRDRLTDILGKLSKVVGISEVFVFTNVAHTSHFINERTEGFFTEALSYLTIDDDDISFAGSLANTMNMTPPQDRYFTILYGVSGRFVDIDFSVFLPLHDELATIFYDLHLEDENTLLSVEDCVVYNLGYF